MSWDRNQSVTNMTLITGLNRLVYQRQHWRVRRETVHWQCQRRWPQEKAGGLVWAVLSHCPNVPSTSTCSNCKDTVAQKYNKSTEIWKEHMQLWTLCIHSIVVHAGHVLRVVWQTRIEFSASVIDHLMHEHKKVIWGVAISALELSGLKIGMKWTKPKKRFYERQIEHFICLNIIWLFTKA